MATPATPATAIANRLITRSLGLLKKLQTQSPTRDSRNAARIAPIANVKWTNLFGPMTQAPPASATPLTSPPISRAARRRSAGQEGLEPPTRGFGVRCSTIRATALDTAAGVT